MADPTNRQSLTQTDLDHLRRCVELARGALDDGDEPFGSVLVDASGTVRFEDRNRVKDGDQTRHPEFELSRWAARHLSPAERAGCVVYTSGEHCAMCSAAHAWVGLGRIVYATSTQQLVRWRTEWGLAAGPVAALPIEAVAPGIETAGPAPEFADEIRSLHEQLISRRRPGWPSPRAKTDRTGPSEFGGRP
ncbi:nucleoside deaminase [Microlunatus elymi]|uniref:Nucleoside deaminase n=1 Tax=Microlunatus elymi TaxID=2596828 RepID=A0A516Q3E0_9ACTN|nr:nucleoside deaminase [Microlunatus elymi]QDP97943.1 nucleoside deaminase [Microlunatus elymi]